MKTSVAAYAAGALLLSSVPAALPADQDPAATAQAAPAPPQPKPCAQGHFREFDFWVGEWEVADPAGKPVGHNSISIQEGGCAIVEHWKSAAGGTGQSLNFYDPKANRWKQKWVSPGSVLEMEGGMKDGAMVLEGPLQYLGQDRQTLLRGTWTRLPDGRVRQRFDESDDQGKTWKPWFDGYYTRKPGSPVPPT